jgi:CMP/dCMP kinase
MAVELTVLDGPAKSGKDAIASKLAKEFGLMHVNSGSIYRAIAAIVHRTGKNRVLVAEMLNPLDLERDDLDTPEVVRLVPKIGQDENVRRAVIRHIRWMIAGSKGAIMSGRSDATEFPEANVKIFLTARVEVRAARWHAMLRPGDHRLVANLVTELSIRDEADMSRLVSPLSRNPTIPPYNTIIDNSDHRDIEETDTMVRHTMKVVLNRGKL